MIKVTKEEAPAVLVENADKWLAELLEAIIEGDDAKKRTRQRRYNHPEIKQAVVRETNGKCAYCEANVRAVAHGDIEHIYPKSLDVSVTYKWENLGFACQVCNQNKSDLDPVVYNIVDPYSEEPMNYIRFWGYLISSNGSAKGASTIKELELDRVELTLERKELFDRLRKLAEMINMAHSPAQRQILIDDFKNNELDIRKPYGALRRDFGLSFQHMIE